MYLEWVAPFWIRLYIFHFQPRENGTGNWLCKIFIWGTCRSCSWWKSPVLESEHSERVQLWPLRWAHTISVSVRAVRSVSSCLSTWSAEFSALVIPLIKTSRRKCPSLNKCAISSGVQNLVSLNATITISGFLYCIKSDMPTGRNFSTRPGPVRPGNFSRALPILARFGL